MIIPNLVRADLIDQKPLQWLWEGRIPLGQLTILEGDPGTAKSQLTCALASHISRGADWPDGAPCPQGITVMANAEDPEEEVIAPRLFAAGADMQNVLIIKPDQHDDNLFTIPEHVAGLETRLKGLNVKLLVFDPLEAFMASHVDLYRNQQTRRAFNTLGLLAKRANCAILIVRHLTKDPSKPALYRGGGSIAIIGAARSGLTVGRDPTDKERCVVAPTKANWSKMRPAITYRLTEDTYLYNEAVIKTSHIVWDGEAKNISADDLITLDENDKSSRPNDTMALFIREQLKNGSKTSTEILGAGAEVGYNRQAMFATARFIGVDIYKAGAMGEGEWTWELRTTVSDEAASRWAEEDFSSLFDSTPPPPHISASSNMAA